MQWEVLIYTYIHTYIHTYIYTKMSEMGLAQDMQQEVYIYVHTCYVLIYPPIPYIASTRCKYFVVLRPVEILLHERGRPSPPPCNVLKICLFFVFFKAIALYFYVLFKFCFTREDTQGSYVCVYVCMYVYMYVCMYVCII